MEQTANAEEELSEEALFAQLVTTTRRLAMDCQSQVEWLRQVGLGEDPVDELALEFDDALTMYRTHHGQGRLSEKPWSQLSTIDSQLSRMSGVERSHLWTVEALENFKEWKTIRSLAADFLSGVQSP